MFRAEGGRVCAGVEPGDWSECPRENLLIGGHLRVVAVAESACDEVG